MKLKLFLVISAITFGPGVRGAQIEYDSAKQVWTLQSGPVEYRLQQQRGFVEMAYLGPLGKAAWPAGMGGGIAVTKDKAGWDMTFKGTPVSRYDIAGLVEGQSLSPENLTLIAQEIRQPRQGCAELRLLYRHRRLPLEIEALYTAWGDTGVFTRQLTLQNRGDRVLQMESVPSLAWRLPSGAYTLNYLYGLWGEERQLASEAIGRERKALINTTGRSTDGNSPWFSLRNETLGVRYAAQLAYSGNWEMLFERSPGGRGLPWREEDHDLRVELGMRFDFGGAATLPPGGSFRLPAVAFTASDGDLDDVANQLHRYQYQYVIARTPTNDPILTEFNVWHALRRHPTAAEAKKYADLAADLGLEAFVIDSGWFSDRGDRTDPIFGDWEPDPVTFPKGLRDVADYVHAKGMKFGVWLEIECAATHSRVVREHPDWVFQYNGTAIPGSLDRVYLNFSNPDVRRWARAVIDRLVREDGVDWWRHDYNIDIGERFDPPGPGRSGTVLYDHLRNYYAFLDEIRAAYPNLVMENCSSGGLRLDLGIIAHTDTTWISDTVDARQSVQLAYGCTVEFTPQVCNHWMAGDTPRGQVNFSDPPGWWDFMLRIPMNGQFGISSRLPDWSPELKKRAAEDVAMYKRLRPIITGADVYHLTPPPKAGTDPTGWMALQYSSPDHGRSAVMVFRLAGSEAERTFRLRGLDPERKYRVSEDGQSRGEFSGRQLADRGLPVRLEAEWRSAVVLVEGVSSR